MILCQASTKFGLYTLLSVLKKRNRDDRRVLFLSAHNQDFEVRNPLIDLVDDENVKRAFDKIMILNDLIAPLHPAQWKPIGNEVEQLAQRSMIEAAIGGKVTSILVESLQVAPALTIANLFSDSAIEVYSDGLMVFSPIKTNLPTSILSRVAKCHYVDYISPVKPYIFEPYSIELSPIKCDDLKSEFANIAHDEKSLPDLRSSAVFLGQYLADSGLMSQDEEIDLYVRGLVQSQRKLKTKRLYFKAHPSFPQHALEQLLISCDEAGLEIEFLSQKVLIEEYLMHTKPSAVISIFSTGLMSANKIFGVPAYKFGTDRVLESLLGTTNSNFIPAVLISECLPSLNDTPSINIDYNRLVGLLETLSSCMHPKRFVKSEKDKERLSKLVNEFEFEDFQPRLGNWLKDIELNNSELMSEYAINGRNYDDFVRSKEELAKYRKPISVSVRLLNNGDFAEAFANSAENIMKTPSSSRHLKVLEEASRHLPEIYKIRLEEIKRYVANELSTKVIQPPSLRTPKRFRFWP